MLYTNLQHIESAAAYKKFISENENVMICCGRMGPKCVPVYGIMEMIEQDYPHVKFADMEFDNPEAHVIRNLPQCEGFMGIPYSVYYKNGIVVEVTSSTQTKDQVTGILNKRFSQ
jgi:thioredoxin 1